MVIVLISLQIVSQKKKLSKTRNAQKFKTAQQQDVFLQLSIFTSNRPTVTTARLQRC
jgi:hypothetical protein